MSHDYIFENEQEQLRYIIYITIYNIIHMFRGVVLYIFITYIQKINKNISSYKYTNNRIINIIQTTHHVTITLIILCCSF